MAKKRGKSKKANSRKGLRSSKTKIRPVLGVEEKIPMNETLRELEILAEEKKVEQKVNGVEKKQEQMEKKEAQIEREEKKIEKETEKVEKLEKEIKEEVMQKPLTRLSHRDLNKGVIGAFIGVVAHFAFIYGKQIAQDISVSRATVLIIFSYILLIMLMYETGYRKVKDRRVMGILPLRATVIYLTSIAVILVIFFLFNQLDLQDLTGLYKQIAVTSVLAALGAGTADLIGRE